MSEMKEAFVTGMTVGDMYEKDDIGVTTTATDSDPITIKICG